MTLIPTLAAVLVIYLRSIRGEFLFDDHVISDMNFKRWELAYQGKDTFDDPPRFFKALVYGFMEPRALTHLGYMWTWKMFGFRPIAWHAVNIALHFANTVLVFLLVMQIRPGLAGPAAFLFAVHPHQVSAVSYISGRAALQTAFFSLAAIYVFIVMPLSVSFPVGTLSIWFAMRSKEDGFWWSLILGHSFLALRALFG